MKEYTIQNLSFFMNLFYNYHKNENKELKEFLENFDKIYDLDCYFWIDNMKKNSIEYKKAYNESKENILNLFYEYCNLSYRLAFAFYWYDDRQKQVYSDAFLQVASCFYDKLHWIFRFKKNIILKEYNKSFSY